MCFIHVCIRSIINPNSCSYSRHLIWEWCFRMMLFTVGSKNFQWLEIGGSLQMITTHSTSSTILRAVWVNFSFFCSHSRAPTVCYVRKKPEDSCNSVISYSMRGLCDECNFWRLKGWSHWWVRYFINSFNINGHWYAVTNYPAVGVFICADNDPFGEHWTAFYWTAALCIQFVLLLLALYQAWKYRDPSEGGGLMRALTRESVLYFFVIFWIYLVSQVLWIHNGVCFRSYIHV